MEGEAMTRDEILAMEAGRELDALVAVEVMEWTRYPNKHGLTVMSRPGAMPHHAQIDQHPNFSTDIAATWEVVEYMGPIPFSLRFQPADAWRTGDGEVYCHAHWTCWFEGSVWAEAPTAPLAICRAALLAAMEMEG